MRLITAPLAALIISLCWALLAAAAALDILIERTRHGRRH